ncbi:uncharacterized protein [Palaemon carinicauda]|uniref:uncharacterized protein n=1 Tax=Palaemon carinicauda TaxID=392227 RepID=UPI0035B5EADD
MTIIINNKVDYIVDHIDQQPKYFNFIVRTLGRDPLRIVKSLSVTVANYKIALDLLDKKYGNVHQTLVILHRKLANIFVPSLNPVELKKFRFDLTIIIEQIKRLSSNDIGHGMVMSFINQKLSEEKLYRKVVEHLRKCDYTLDEFIDAIDFIIRMLEDDALQRGDKFEPDKRVDVSVTAKSKPVQNNSCPFFPSTSARSNSSSKYSTSQSTTSRPVVNAMPRQHETAPHPSKDKVEPKQRKSAKVAQMSSVDLPCTILPTAMAEINHKQGSKRVHLFLDTGSQRSFMSAKIARQLGLPVVGKVALNIGPFGSAEISGQYDAVRCRVEIGRRVIRMKLVAHENVDVPIHNAGYVQVRRHLLSKEVTLADPENKSAKLKKVHILVGADYLNNFIIDIEKVDGISLFLTHNGISPYGKVPQWLIEGQKIEHVKTLRVFRIASEPNQFDIDEWWCLDHVGIAPSEQYTVREAEAMQKKDSRTTPLRIVFNASAKSKGHKSLNECLLPGPNLVEVAYHLLIKFRLKEYAMLADISKAFRRVLLDPRDAKYTRFLWREVAGRPLTFAFRVVVFGITASPFLLQQVLNCHFEKEGRPDLAKSFYVDNCLSTIEKVESMRQEHESVNKILERAGMPLEGWASNNLAFNSEKQWSEPVNVNVLGLRWARDVDRLCMKESKRISELGEGWVPTERRVLSLLVSIYHPLGFISPLFV